MKWIDIQAANHPLTCEPNSIVFLKGKGQLGLYVPLFLFVAGVPVIIFNHC